MLSRNRNNLNRADAILQRAEPKEIDLLVLPELAFTGKPISIQSYFYYYGSDNIFF